MTSKLIVTTLTCRPMQRVSGVAGAPATCTPLKRPCPDYSTMLFNPAALPGMALQAPLIQQQLQQQLPQQRAIYTLPG